MLHWLSVNSSAAFETCRLLWADTTAGPSYATDARDGSVAKYNLIEEPVMPYSPGDLPTPTLPTVQICTVSREVARRRLQPAICCLRHRLGQRGMLHYWPPVNCVAAFETCCLIHSQSLSVLRTLYCSVLTTGQDIVFYLRFTGRMQLQTTRADHARWGLRHASDARERRRRRA